MMPSLILAAPFLFLSSLLQHTTGWAATVAFIYETVPGFQETWHVSPSPHQLMASALGLLLVFRTNAVSTSPLLPTPQAPISSYLIPLPHIGL